jgi:hypothetical protein
VTECCWNATRPNKVQAAAEALGNHVQEIVELHGAALRHEITRLKGAAAGKSSAPRRGSCSLTPARPILAHGPRRHRAPVRRSCRGRRDQSPSIEAGSELSWHSSACLAGPLGILRVDVERWGPPRLASRRPSPELLRDSVGRTWCPAGWPPQSSAGRASVLRSMAFRATAPSADGTKSRRLGARRFRPHQATSPRRQISLRLGSE